LLFETIEKTKFIENIKKNYNFTTDDVKELTKYLTYKSCSKGSRPITFGDNDKKLMILLKGSLRTYAKNQSIKDWYWAISIHNTLRLWKSEQFDHK